MRLLNVSHKGINYEFRLLELSGLVQVIKGNLLTYEMRLKGHLFVCNCPGYKYHQKCWHRTIINQLLTQPTINEPWAWWAEEFVISSFKI